MWYFKIVYALNFDLHIYLLICHLHIHVYFLSHDAERGREKQNLVINHLYSRKEYCSHVTFLFYFMDEETRLAKVFSPFLGGGGVVYFFLILILKYLYSICCCCLSYAHFLLIFSCIYIFCICFFFLPSLSFSFV